MRMFILKWLLSDKINRIMVSNWLFPSCDIDPDTDRENVWNALDKLKNEIDNIKGKK